MLFSAVYSHAAAFNWQSLLPTFSANSVVDAQSGITVTVTPAGDTVEVDDIFGTFGTTGNVIYPSLSMATQITVTLSQQVEVASIFVFDTDDTRLPIDLDFTATGGYNFAVNAPVDNSSSLGAYTLQLTVSDGGIPNHLDNITEKNVVPESVATNDGFLLEAEPGVKNGTR